MQSLLQGLTGPSPTVDIAFADAATRKYKVPDSEQKQFIFTNGEDVAGDIKITVPGGKRLDHVGVKIELRGVVELTQDKAVHEVVTITKDVLLPGQLSGLAAFKFAFPKASLPFDSYVGINARIRYFLRATVARQGSMAGGPLTRDCEFTVLNSVQPPALGVAPQPDTSVKLEVGIEDCLHIEFQYNKTRLFLTEAVTGCLDFLLVRIRIKHAEIALIRREAVGLAGSASSLNDSETVSRYEIMDGAPVRGERIPIRMLLAGLDLGPTMLGVAGMLSVRYFLNLVLVDDEDRRYFKQCEITLERRAP